MLIGSICAAIAICLLGGFLCFRYVRQTFDEVDHMLDQAIQGHFDFSHDSRRNPSRQTLP